MSNLLYIIPHLAEHITNEPYEGSYLGIYHAKAHFPIDCNNYVTFEITNGLDDGPNIEILDEKPLSKD